MAMTSSARSRAATVNLASDTPRHLHDVRETDEDVRLFDDDDDDSGIPPQSPASPTRSRDRAAATAAALTSGPSLEEGVYVSEPHFAPPRMDESQATFHGDDRGRDEWDAALFSKSLAVAPSPSSTRRSPPTTSGGFVPSPAERRAAAIALERSQSAARENGVEARRAELEPEPEPEPISATDLRVADSNFPTEPVESTEPDGPDAMASPSRSARSVGAAHDEEVSVSDDDDDDADDDADDDDADDAETSRGAEPASDSVDADFLAALMAEAMMDAEEDAKVSEKNHASAGMERVLRGAAAVIRAEEAARVSTSFFHSARSSGSMGAFRSRGHSPSPPPAPSRPSRPRRASPARSSPRASLRFPARRHRPTVDDLALDAADLRASVSSLRASLEAEETSFLEK
jgi:hypothetical protein